MEPRNRLILRRTLSAISQLHAVWSGLLGWGFLASPQVGVGLSSSWTLGKLMLVHAAALFGAGFTLWKPRRWATGLTLGAVTISLSIVALDAWSQRWQSLVFDTLYPLVALGIFWEIRRS